MIETVYLDRDNPNTVTLSEDGALIDFGATTRMILSFEGSAIVADTSVDATLIDWSAGLGVVEFNLNDLAIDAGSELYATLVSYDATHTDGQVLISSSVSRKATIAGSLRFLFLDA